MEHLSSVTDFWHLTLLNSMEDKIQEIHVGKKTY